MASEDPAVYRIHSGVRGRHNKLARRQAVGRARFVQRLAGGEITVRRARPVTVKAAVIKKHLKELVLGQEEGRLEVRTLGGELVDLGTMKAAAPPAPKPQPAKKVDAGVAEDKPQGPPIVEQGSPGKSEEELSDLPSGHAQSLAVDDTPVEAPSGADPVAERKKQRKGKKKDKEG